MPTGRHYRPGLFLRIAGEVLPHEDGLETLVLEEDLKVVNPVTDSPGSISDGPKERNELKEVLTRDPVEWSILIDPFEFFPLACLIRKGKKQMNCSTVRHKGALGTMLLHLCQIFFDGVREELARWVVGVSFGVGSGEGSFPWGGVSGARSKLP
ncbi:hypothetical protein [Granulicella sp. WH15]|uniref:hypothetical protein n=1 Tax=Granulicella sp. WH15 TaxID=2602070 RepID=UPI0013A5BB4B|nr:hypothetical protein [Granulicella sp. WH15]